MNITKAKKDCNHVLNDTEEVCYNERYQEGNESDQKTDLFSADAVSRKKNDYETFWQNLTIADDFIFGKVMLDRELCTELLQRIFPHQQIDRIEYIKAQESIQPDKEAKGIRLDVFVKNNKNVAFCVEMQTRNTDNLPKRSRYYQSLVDLELLDRGQDYDNLAPAYIIFICPFDLFHLGYHIYEFRNYCTQEHELELGDQAVKIFLNANGTADDVSPRLKEFLDYVAGREQENPSDFIVKLQNAVYHAKQNREWRRERMIMYFHIQDARSDGKREERERMVLAMLEKHIDRELIKDIAAISDEELDAIIACNK